MKDKLFRYSIIKADLGQDGIRLIDSSKAMLILLSNYYNQFDYDGSEYEDKFDKLRAFCSDSYLDTNVFKIDSNLCYSLKLSYNGNLELHRNYKGDEISYSSCILTILSGQVTVINEAIEDRRNHPELSIACIVGELLTQLNKYFSDSL